MIAVGWRAPRGLLVFAALAGTSLACAERDELGPSPSRAASPPADAAPAARADPTQTADAGAGTALDPTAPAALGGYHLDEPDVEYEPGNRESRARGGRPIEIVLRSTPAGAMAAVDGVAVGPTPALWQGTADGRARDFTFVLPGHAIARYRFVPTRSGIVHGTLARLKSLPDAGVPERTTPP